MQKFLPPFMFLALIPPMAALSYFNLEVLRILHQTGVPYWEIGICTGIGFALLIGARVQFKRANAEIMTFATPRNLVTTGLFRFSRNPMYLGFLILLIAIALYINLWQALIAPLIFFLAANYWYIPFEENVAMEAFGSPYRQYKEEVRRWI